MSKIHGLLPFIGMRTNNGIFHHRKLFWKGFCGSDECFEGCSVFVIYYLTRVITSGDSESGELILYFMD